MRVAVTGSSGLIGTALLERLRDRGDEVVRLVRAAPTGPDEVRWDPASGRIDDESRAALDGIDAAVNLAGAGIGDKRWSPDRKRDIRDSRVRGTDVLARTMAGLSQRPAVLVSGSAVGYYGDRGDQELTETSGPGHDFLADLCQDWEQATAPAQEAGIRVATARTGLVLSRRGGALPRLRSIVRTGLGGRLGSGRQWWGWISLDDEVSALVWLLDHDLSGPFDLTAPDPATNAELTQALGHALHRPTVLPVPRLGPRLLLGRELADALLFTSARVLPAALEASGFAFAHTTLDDALAAVLG